MGGEEDRGTLPRAVASGASVVDSDRLTVPTGEGGQSPYITARPTSRHSTGNSGSIEDADTSVGSEEDLESMLQASLRSRKSARYHRRLQALADAALGSSTSGARRWQNRVDACHRSLGSLTALSTFAGLGTGMRPSTSLQRSTTIYLRGRPSTAVY